VAAAHLFLCRLAPLDVVGEGFEENPEPLGGLGVAERRVQLGKEPVRDDVYRIASASSSRLAPRPRARPTR
jgi:hypothetical protein